MHPVEGKTRLSLLLTGFYRTYRAWTNRQSKRVAGVNLSRIYEVRTKGVRSARSVQ